MREVQGMIFFGEAGLDPQTKPWTSLVRSIVLVDELRHLAERAPEHPLVAVFQPLLAERETDLEHTAGGFYRTIKNSKLKKGVKEALEEVFVSWLLQRLPNRSKKEIEKMLIGELPELVDTRAGQDILKIGEERGLKIGEERGPWAGACRGCGHPARGQAGTADEVPAAEAPDVGSQATASTAGGCHPVGVPRPAGCLAGGARQVNSTACRRVLDETFGTCVDQSTCVSRHVQGALPRIVSTCFGCPEGTARLRYQYVEQRL